MAAIFALIALGLVWVGEREFRDCGRTRFAEVCACGALVAAVAGIVVFVVQTF